MKKLTIKLLWFDKLKGIGEGQLHDGSKVFLNSYYLQNNSLKLLTLPVGGEIECFVKTGRNGALFAYKD